MTVKRRVAGRLQGPTGLYIRPDAARLLGLTPATLRRWVDGYTYALQDQRSDDRSRRSIAPVLRPSLPVFGQVVALTFHELMELRVVKEIVDKGVSLRHVRAAANLASRRFKTPHPFASRRVFTDGNHIFSALHDFVDAPNVVKWTPDEIDQVIAGPIFEQFLSEIEFDDASSLAQRWWPRGRAVPVTLDPKIRFGSPVVSGTGVTTAAVASIARASSVRAAAVAYEIDERSAQAAVDFEKSLNSA